MSEYPEAGFLKEFVRRTKSNLKLVEKALKENENEAYEVTQLLNSLFGLLILPKEKYYDRLRDVADEEVPVFQKCKQQIKGDNYNNINYQQSIRHLRNAAGHPNNIQVRTENGTIMKIVLEDRNKFSIELNTSDLKDLVCELCDVLIKNISAVEGL